MFWFLSRRKKRHSSCSKKSLKRLFSKKKSFSSSELKVCLSFLLGTAQRQSLSFLWPFSISWTKSYVTKAKEAKKWKQKFWFVEYYFRQATDADFHCSPDKVMSSKFCSEAVQKIRRLSFIKLHFCLQCQTMIVRTGFPLKNNLSLAPLHPKHLIFYSGFQRKKRGERRVECDLENETFIILYSYRRGWQKCDNGGYFHRLVLKNICHIASAHSTCI